MKRDMDLVRTILLNVEASDHAGLNDLSIDVHSPETLTYHYGLLNEAGLINAEYSLFPSTGINWIVYGLTWDGHEFIESARDNNRWERAKNVLTRKGGAPTFEILKQVLLDLEKDQLGMS